jgi:hypothetical protein
MVGGLNAWQETVLPPRRVDMENYPKGAKANLRPGDAVVIEATTNAWTLYEVTLPHVSKVVVAHPLDVKQIANARVKTSGKGDLDTKKGIILEPYHPQVSLKAQAELLGARNSSLFYQPGLYRSLIGRPSPGQHGWLGRRQSYIFTERLWRTVK